MGNYVKCFFKFASIINFYKSLKLKCMDSSEQKWYDKTWLIVVLCIVFFPVGLYALWKNSSIKKGWKIAVTILIALIVIANFGDKDPKADSPVVSANTKAEEKTESKEPEAVKSNWSYTEDADKMTNEKRYFASCVSTNEIDFEFPYNGGSFFTLTVRQMGKGNEIVLQVSKGQFMTSISSSESIRAKFDDGQAFTFSFNSASDGSSDVIFIENSTKFLSKLKTAKKLLIEAPFYSAGRQHIEFDVAGLNWSK